ncbi:YjiH family protein [Bacillus spongiae]|uniref:YjiH family protein n=1 Tax=Bacillus spongiae TaxID=2683610 RepID=A0ABU8HC85_9BACI
MDVEKESYIKLEEKEQILQKGFWGFFIPSFLGVLLFLVPFSFQGEITIGVGVFATYVHSVFLSYLPSFMTGIMFLSIVFSLLTKGFQPKWIIQHPFFNSLFNISNLWLMIRMIGVLFSCFTLWEIGPEWVWSDVTGGTMLNVLIPVLTTWFLFAGLLMPLLLEFGLMDFIGVLLRKIMVPLFTLPGRSAIDAVASWMGSGTVGVLITIKQYEAGYYSKREAAVIATNFSVASIAFSLVIIQFIGLEHMFVPFYLTVFIAGSLAAIICPRIPPLSRKEDTYYELVGKQINEDVSTGKSSFASGVEQAIKKAEQVKSFTNIFKQGVQNVLDIWFGLIPLVMALGTLALVVAEYTPLFTILAYPIVPILTLLQLPEAQAAAPAMIVGFADMFLPAVLGSGIESELTRFVVAVMSLTQLIYMSEIGILLLKSKIPLRFSELLIIFIQRTFITLPVATVIGHILY